MTKGVYQRKKKCIYQNDSCWDCPSRDDCPFIVDGLVIDETEEDAADEFERRLSEDSGD